MRGYNCREKIQIYRIAKRLCLKTKALDKWACQNKVVLDFSRPGKLTNNAFIESFNGSFREECLNVNRFLSIDDAREKIKAFKGEITTISDRTVRSEI